MEAADVVGHKAVLFQKGDWPVEIDHRDGDALNDRWEDLREATRTQNEANKPKYRNNKSGHKGVFFHRGRYVASIQRGWKRTYLGYFRTLDAAVSAYRSASIALDGEFSRTR